MKLVYLLLGVTVALFGAMFSVLNANPVPINFYFGTSAMPLSVLLVVMLSIGALFGLLSCFSIIIKIKIENRTLKQKFNLAEKEISNLRALPIKDDA